MSFNKSAIYHYLLGAFVVLVSLLIYLSGPNCKTPFDDGIPSTGNWEFDMQMRDRHFARRHSHEHALNFVELISLMSKEKWRPALSMNIKLLKRQPIDPWMWACRSAIELRLGLYKEALAHAETAIKQDATYDVGYGARADCNYAIGVKQRSRSLIKSASKDYSKALSLSQSDDSAVEFLLGLAKCQVFQEDYEIALATLSKISHSNSTKPVLLLRSTIYEKLGRTQDSTIEEGKALKLPDPKFFGPDWRELD